MVVIWPGLDDSPAGTWEKYRQVLHVYSNSMCYRITWNTSHPMHSGMQGFMCQIPAGAGLLGCL